MVEIASRIPFGRSAIAVPGAGFEETRSMTEELTDIQAAFERSPAGPKTVPPRRADAAMPSRDLPEWNAVGVRRPVPGPCNARYAEIYTPPWKWPVLRFGTHTPRIDGSVAEVKRGLPRRSGWRQFRGGQGIRGPRYSGMQVTWTGAGQESGYGLEMFYPGGEEESGSQVRTLRWHHCCRSETLCSGNLSESRRWTPSPPATARESEPEPEPV